MSPLLLYTSMILSYLVHVLLHEFGHVLAAIVARKRILEVKIGFGTRSLGFRLGGCRVLLTSWPFTGNTLVCAGTIRRYRVRQWLFYIGGPLVTLGLIIAAFVWRASLMGNPAPLPASSGYLSHGDAWVDGLMVFGLTGVWILFVSLVPRSWVTPEGQELHSDGRQILLLPGYTLEQARHDLLREHVLYAASLYYRHRKRYDRWIRGITRRAHRHGPEGWALHFADGWSTDDLPESAIQFLRRLLDDEWTSTPSANWAGTAEVLGNIPLLSSRPDLLREAITHMRRAVDAFPDIITYQGTLGALLFESGAHDEAKPILEKVLTSESPHDRAIASAYLAAIHARNGDLERARQLHGEAQRLMPEHPIVKRVMAGLSFPQ